jgi:hypothetical protein
MVEIAHLCVDLDDTDRAETLIKILTPDAHLHGVLPVPILYGGPASYALARLHEMLGMVDVAIQYYEEALDSTVAMEARPMQARILLDMAGPISRSGDKLRGSELEAEGTRIADEIDCHL